MLLAYVDDSGNTGDFASKSGATPFYALGCVLLHSDDWPAAFDSMVGFRRALKASFGVPVRSEIKANYLIRGSGAFKGLGLSPAQRNLIYKYHLDQVGNIDARAFGIVIDKRVHNLHGPALVDLAWETVLQRLERTTTFEQVNLMLVHDEGEERAVRTAYRKARRYLTAGSAFGGRSITLAAPAFLDDPVPRSSASSYFIQLADLVAYASWRTLVKPSPTVGAVVPQWRWNSIGKGTHSAVNRLAGGTPGIVVRTH